MADPRVITIRTPGLSLPEPGTPREAYTRSERVSVATLALVAALALRLIATDRSRHKVVLLDEAWVLFSSSQGRALLNRIVRLGRAFNATVLLVSQRLDDLGELSDLVGGFFLFGQDSRREAERGLEALGIEPDDGALAARLAEFRTGRCLVRDLNGRIGEVQIDPLPDLLAVLDNTPGRALA